MSIDSTGLMNEILEIAAGGKRPMYTLTAEIFYDTMVIDVFRVANVNRWNEYTQSYGEEFIVDLVINSGLYNKYLIDNADRLKVNLIISKTIGTGLPDITKFTMRAFPKSTHDPRVSQQRTADLSPESIGQFEMTTYQFQLLDLAMEQMRLMETGGNYPVTTPVSVLRVMLGGLGGSLELPLEHKPKAPEIIAPDSEIVKNTVVVKQGTNMCDLAGYLQAHYGLYNTQLGSFYKNQTWHVWPLYNTKRFELAKRTLTLINVPRDRLPDIETTHQVRGSSVVILLTGDTAFNDNSNRQQNNDGNGTRAVRASAISGDEGRVVDGGKVYLERGTSNTEIKTNDRRSGVNYVPTSTEVTDNTPRVLSRTATVNGTSAQFTWESSDPSLLVPGMPVKLLYMKGDKVVQRYGVLTGDESLYFLANSGVLEGGMLVNTALTVFMSNEDDEYNTSL